MSFRIQRTRQKQSGDTSHFLCKALVIDHSASADEPDIAVFRFTLGIPGFDDADIPRILGWAAIALLTLNHILNDSPSDASQVRSFLVFQPPLKLPQGRTCFEN